jgi:ferritin-like metal-binding protein YciE
MADEKNLNTVQQYVGDMIALEDHIEEAIDRQLSLAQDYAPADEAVQRFHQMVKGHREGLKAHLTSLGGSESSPIKTAVADLFGKAAGMVDKVRTEAVSKTIRDDYTAFNHAAIGYAMLHTTAHALGQASTADIAIRYLRDYAEAVQRINQIIPGIVVWELRKDGHTVDDSAEQHSVEALNTAWRDTSPSTGASVRATAGVR